MVWYSMVWYVLFVFHCGTLTCESSLQIHLQKGNYKLAEQSLEVGLSYNFEVSFAKAVLTRSLQDYKHKRKKRQGTMSRTQLLL